MIGQILSNQFRVERLLGSGGMGAVYLAVQIDMERPVVVKVLHPELTAGSPTAVERFKREAKAVARLNHPHVVQVHVFGTTEHGQLFLAMEYVDGVTLADAIATHGSFPEARALKILDQICGALIEAHGAGLVHRDLKPENVMLANRFGNADYVKVLDFGIARIADDTSPNLTKTGSVFGTPRYMAPEQARGKRADARSDLYAIGVMLWVMLTGEHPFGETDSAVDYLIKHATEDILSPLIRHPHLVLQPRTDRLLAKLVKKNPDERFQSAAELQREVRTAMRDLPDHLRNAPTPVVGVVPPPIHTAEAQTFDPSFLDQQPPPPAPHETFRPVTLEPQSPPPRAPQRPPWALMSAAAVLFVAAGAGAGIWFAAGADPSAESPTIVAPAPAVAQAPPATPTVEAAPAVTEPKVTVTPPKSTPQKTTKAKPKPKATPEPAKVEATPAPAPKKTSTKATSKLPKKGKPWRGVPVPADVTLTSSSPAAVVYETSLGAQQLVDFYLHHMAQYGPAQFASGIQFQDPKSPLASISVSMSALGRMLILSPNAMVMEVEIARAGDTVFGLPIFPGAIETSLTPLAAMYTVEKPIDVVMDWYRKKVPHQSGLMILDNVRADEPNLLITTQNAEGLAWEMLNVSRDNSVPGRTVTRIIITRKQD
jgi:serine/threonine protein kinase